MFEQLGELEEEFDKLESSLSDIAAAGDRRATRDAGRRYAELKPVVEGYRVAGGQRGARWGARLMSGEGIPT